MVFHYCFVVWNIHKLVLFIFMIWKYRAWEKVSEKLPRKLQKSCDQFNFKEHCVYCGEICDLVKDPKHPDR